MNNAAILLSCCALTCAADPAPSAVGQGTRELWTGVARATCAAVKRQFLDARLLIARQGIQRLSSTVTERLLPGAHPAAYYEYAARLWGSGRSDDAVFWLHAGRLRYRFHLLANPTLDPSGDPALFASLEATVAQPILLYAGSNPTKWGEQIEAVLKWDAANPNGFTSKAAHRKELEEVRAGVADLRGYITTHRDELTAQRQREGIGPVGIIDGVYVEEIQQTMPKDWPPLTPCTSPDTIAGVYVDSNCGLLGRILFWKDQAKVVDADSYELAVEEPGILLVVARQHGQELLRRTIAVRQAGGAIVFEERRTGKEAGLSEGYELRTVYLRLNAARELVMERDYLIQGQREGSTTPIKLSYRYWSREKRLPAKKR